MQRPRLRSALRTSRWLMAALVLGIANLSSTVTALGPDPEDPNAKLLATMGPKEQLGAWFVPDLPPEADRMQAAHIALLPDGMVLIFNGSSARVHIDSQGQWGDVVDAKEPAVVDNSAVFDPMAPHVEGQLNHGFTKISSPHTPIQSSDKLGPNDPFCSGHLHTPEGDVLIVSGTREIYGALNFLGTPITNLYQWQSRTWKDESWIRSKELRDGHWYPTLAPLPTGEIMVVSGLSKSKNPAGNSSILEFFNAASETWTSVDVRNIANSPFVRTYQRTKDVWDHYPRIHSLPDGRFLITGDGTGDGGHPDSPYSYLMTVSPAQQAGQPPNVSFEIGPNRGDVRRHYSSSVMDPNGSGDILLFGGLYADESQTASPAINFKNPEEALSRKMQRYVAPSSGSPIGDWQAHEDVLGDRVEDGVQNHNVIILPTKQLLVINGGRYFYYQPRTRPLLLSPSPTEASGYAGTTLNPGTQTRLYHSTALLLPDGRIFTAGGQGAFAGREEKNGKAEIHLEARMDKAGTIIPKERGLHGMVAENYQVELFYPPYLFADGARPQITQAPESIHYGAQHTMQVTSPSANGASVVLIKLGSVTHGIDMGQRLAELEFQQNDGTVTFTSPTNRHLYTPGYYMLFYVSATGKPSVAEMVKLQ